MPQYIGGIDEAGYGPQLGPLVISGVLLEVPDDVAADGADLWKHLKDCVAKPPKPCKQKAANSKPRRRRRRTQRILVGDSKLVYTPARGTTDLERSVLALAGWMCARPIMDIEDLMSMLLCSQTHAMTFCDPWSSPAFDRFPLTEDLDVPVAPLVPKRDDIRPVFMGSRVFSVTEFNRRCCSCDSKAQVNWEAVTHFLRRCWDCAGDGTVQVTIDRQGGRAYYAGQLQDVFPDGFVWEVEQGPTISTYRIQRGARELYVSFKVDADDGCLPVAMASMFCKYLRELLMARLNAFFLQHEPELRPTAGYYGDAGRFLEDTALLRRELGIEDDTFIRMR